MQEEKSRAVSLILEAFANQGNADMSAHDLYDYVVNRRGVDPLTYKAARKTLGVVSAYRVGTAHWFKSPLTEEGLVKMATTALRPLRNKVDDWDAFLGVVKQALRELK